MSYKRFLAVLLLTLTMIFASIGSAFADNAKSNDIEGHWAKDIISDWVYKDLIKGYADNTIRPDSKINRAEFVTLVNRAFKISNDSRKLVFRDVSQDNWCSGDVSAATDVGYISGYPEGSFRPYETVTREQAGAMIARLLTLEKGSETSYTSNLKDQKQLSKWSTQYIEAILAKGIMKGYEDQTFQPGKGITRAEAVVTINSAIKATGETAVYGKSGIYGPEQGIKTINGNVIISGAEVTLQNTIITGNLLFAVGIGEGNAALKNVTVKGSTIVMGGGPNSITLEDCTLPDITVGKDGVRVVSSGNTSVKVVQLKSGATLVEISTAGSGFENITISQGIPPGASVNLSGKFKQVNVQANIDLVVQSGTVNDMNITKDAEGATVLLSKTVEVQTLTVDGRANITGEGKIETAYVNSNNTVIEPTPAKTVMFQGVTTQVGGKELAENTSTITEASGSDHSGPVNVQGIAIAQQNLVETVGETVQLTVDFDPANVINQNTIWQSDDETVAAVDASGLMTAVGEGITTITAVSEVGNKKATTTVFVTADLRLPQSPQPPAETAESQFTYTVKDGKATITGYSKYGTRDIVIPHKLGGYPVTAIAEYAFYYQGLGTVVIPEGVTSIGEKAFCWNGIWWADIPRSVTSIGHEAFAINDDYLTITAFTGSVAHSYAIDNHFSFVPSEFSYILAYQGKDYTEITDYSLYGPKDIEIPGMVGWACGYPVESIGDSAFFEKQLTSVKFPGGWTGHVNQIGNNAFAHNRLTSISIPNTITSIGKSAFAGNKLTSVGLSVGVKSIESFTFTMNKLTSISIPNGVTSIGEDAFSYNALTSASIPSSVTSIGPNAFYGNKLTSVNIPDGLTSITSKAFSCNALTSVNIPAGVTSIENESFAYNMLTSVSIPDSVTSIGNGAFRWNQLTSVNIPDRVTTIGDKAFHGNQLTSVRIPEGATSIGINAFMGNQLTFAIIPESVTSIGAGAFSGNQQNPEDLKIYGIAGSAAETYANDNGHTFVTLITYTVTDGKAEITGYHYDGPKDAAIPGTLGGYPVTSIGELAFATNGLTSVSIPDSVTSIGESAFYQNQLTSVMIPDSVISIGRLAFASNRLTSVTIPDSVTSIGVGVFDSNRLTSVVIPASVTSIGDFAFYQNQLGSVTIPDSVTSIGNNAFSGNQQNPADLIIQGASGSAAETYANSNGHTMEYI